MTNIWPKIISTYKNKKHLLTSIFATFKAGYPAKKLKVIGVTGTDGKTTTAHLIYEILKTAGKKTALISTLGLFTDQEVQDTGLHTTTPDATVLQPILATLAQEKYEYVILEVTSHGLDQHRVMGCNFLVGVLTNITHEHLDYHKTFKNYQNTKAKLFRNVKFGVLNKDDKSFDFIKSKTNKHAKIISYSLKNPAILTTTIVQLNKQGQTFYIKEKNSVHKINTSLPGTYNISNILAAAGAARALAIGWRTIQEAVGAFKNVRGRFEEIPNKKGIKIIVDFAHTPASLENLLADLSRLKAASCKLTVVFGCAGERDRQKRPIMGKIAGEIADISIFTTEDPRSENVNTIIESMAKGAKQSGATELNPDVQIRNHIGGGIALHAFIREPDRQKAVNLALKLAKKGDIVAICGKGHEKSMAYGKTEIPWSDQEAINKALK